MEWGGCSDNIAYGYRKSKDFMDLKRQRTRADIRTIVHKHNNEAGRLVSEKHTFIFPVFPPLLFL